MTSGAFALPFIYCFVVGFRLDCDDVQIFGCFTITVRHDVLGSSAQCWPNGNMNLRVQHPDFGFRTHPLFVQTCGALLVVVFTLSTSESSGSDTVAVLNDFLLVLGASFALAGFHNGRCAAAVTSHPSNQPEPGLGGLLAVGRP